MSSYTPSGFPFESRSHRCDRHPIREDPDRCSQCDYVRTARRLDRERGDYSRRIIELANGDTSPRGSLSGRNSDRVRELYHERETRTDRANEDVYSRDLGRSGRDLRDILLGGSARSSGYVGSSYSSGYGPNYGSGYGSGYINRDRERDSDRYSSSQRFTSRDNSGSSRHSASRDDYGSSRYFNSREGSGSRGYSSSTGRLAQSSGYSYRRDSSSRYPSLPGDEGYNRGGRRGAYSEQTAIYLDSDSDDDY